MISQELESEKPAQAAILGPRECAYWSEALKRMQAVRLRLPVRVIDVDHRRFCEDPLRVVNSIYEAFGLTLSLSAEQQMRAWIAANQTSKCGPHEYAIDSWGVTAEEIRKNFADYRAHHQFG